MGITAIIFYAAAIVAAAIVTVIITPLYSGKRRAIAIIGLVIWTAGSSAALMNCLWFAEVENAFPVMQSEYVLGVALASLVRLETLLELICQVVMFIGANTFLVACTSLFANYDPEEES